MIAPLMLAILIILVCALILTAIFVSTHNFYGGIPVLVIIVFCLMILFRIGPFH